MVAAVLANPPQPSSLSESWSHTVQEWKELGEQLSK
jgi:hypothetical protein